MGGPNDPPVFGHENTALFCGRGLAGTPLHVPLLGLGGMECSVYVPRLCGDHEDPSVVVPSPFLVEGALLFCSRHSWPGHLAVRVNCALGSVGWAAQCAPLHPTYPTCGRSDSCMVGVRRCVATSPYVWPAIHTRITGPASAWLVGSGSSAERRSYQHLRLVCYTRITGPASARLIGSGCGAERRSYQHSRLACYTRITGPASVRPVGPGSCADRPAAPDDPVRGARPPLVPG